MKIGYARVSTEDQNLDLQREALLTAGCERVLEEKLSGADRRRPALQATRRILRRGDVLVVWKLDRLGRSLQDLVMILGSLERRGIGFRSISDGIDTTTPAGKLLFHIAGAVAEFERSLISDRTKAGMRVAKRNGSAIGRPRCLTDQQIAYVRVLAHDHGIAVATIARQLAVGRTTIWRALAAPASA